MKILRLATVLAIGLFVTGCATSTTAPDVVKALAPEKIAAKHISNIIGQAAPGVVMTQSDLDRVCQKIKIQINAGAPGIMVGPSSPAAATALTMKLNFTDYDAGNAFARAMLAGLGQIHIDADVLLVDAGGNALGQYKVSKQFAFGGIYGGSTRIEDVEDGFAKSVAEIVKK